MLFGGLYELRIEIFIQRSLDTNKKAIRSLQRKTKSNQVLVSWPWRNLGEAFVSRLLADTGRGHGQPWQKSGAASLSSQEHG
jgi:hypothetical protein